MMATNTSMPRYDDSHISTTCAHCGQWARQHLPECASGAPWARFARRMAREFACDQRTADGYARLFWPYLDALGGEGAIIDAGRHGRLGKIQDRAALAQSESEITVRVDPSSS